MSEDKPKSSTDFSRFFTEATPEEKLKLFEEVAKKANEDQRRIYEASQKEQTEEGTNHLPAV